MRHCEFCGQALNGNTEKFGQTWFYYCPNCAKHCSSREVLEKHVINKGGK